MKNNDELNNKDTSFKKFFSIMWAFNYIQLFIGFLLASILIPAFFGIDYIKIDILFVFILILISYLGFYREWKKYLKEK